MTREEAEKWEKEIQALGEGKTIQMRPRDHGEWENVSNPSWFLGNEYRIKPESKLVLVPFDLHDMLLMLTVVRKLDGSKFSITGQTQKYVLIINEWVSYNDLLDSYEFSDGSPCGKVVEK